VKAAAILALLLASVQKRIDRCHEQSVRVWTEITRQGTTEPLYREAQLLRMKRRLLEEERILLLSGVRGASERLDRRLRVPCEPEWLARQPVILSEFISRVSAVLETPVLVDPAVHAQLYQVCLDAPAASVGDVLENVCAQIGARYRLIGGLLRIEPGDSHRISKTLQRYQLATVR
jgi:hypothetical protein